MSFDRFPKRRPPLPAEFARIYLAHYKTNREGKSPASWLSKKMEGWLHKQVAGEGCGLDCGAATLEIGAGTLNQLEYERREGPYDIVEPFRDLYECSPHLPRIRNIYDTIHQIPLSPVYGRITAIATFEHVCDLPQVVARSGLLLTTGGTLRVSIPSEGAPLWRLGWMLTTGLEFWLRHGTNYGVLLRHEHVNTAAEVEQVLRYFFANVSARVLGLNRRLSFYQSFICSHPIVTRCEAYL
ncbi:MAG: class I SAM-dependent methyltransferase [Acidobacteriia bacterium]|nr:class I SAM-dependent methyltransferase [Terriglobia bacterium]